MLHSRRLLRGATGEFRALFRAPQLLAAVAAGAVMLTLNLPWFGLHAALGQGVAWGAELLSREGSSGIHVRWLARDTSVLEGDVFVDVGDPSSGLAVRFPLAFQTQAFVPFSLLVALTVAAVAWKRRNGRVLTLAAFALLAGEFVTSVTARMLVQLASIGRIDLSEWLQGALTTFWTIVAAPNMTYAIPVLLWAGLMYLSDPAHDAGAPEVCP